MIKGIVAVSKDWSIGKTNKDTGKGELLYTIKRDMQLFQEVTSNCGFVVFGENTYLSLPTRPLKNRVNIVLCPEGHEYEGCICFHTFEKLLSVIQVIAKRFDVYICGGGMLYAAMLEYCQELIVTKVDDDSHGDVGFPNLDKLPEFEHIYESDILEEDQYRFTFNIYRRLRNA